MEMDISKIEERDEGWEAFMKLSDKEKSEILLSKAREQMSDEDRVVLDDIIKLLEENQDKHTDLVWINDKLQDKYPELNPLAIMSFFFLLKACGVVDLDNS